MCIAKCQKCIATTPSGDAFYIFVLDTDDPVMREPHENMRDLKHSDEVNDEENIMYAEDGTDELVQNVTKKWKLPSEQDRIR